MIKKRVKYITAAITLAVLGLLVLMIALVSTSDNANAEELATELSEVSLSTTEDGGLVVESNIIGVQGILDSGSTELLDTLLIKHKPYIGENSPSYDLTVTGLNNDEMSFIWHYNNQELELQIIRKPHDGITSLYIDVKLDGVTLSSQPFNKYTYITTREIKISIGYGFWFSHNSGLGTTAPHGHTFSFLPSDSIWFEAYPFFFNGQLEIKNNSVITDTFAVSEHIEYNNKDVRYVDFKFVDINGANRVENIKVLAGVPFDVPSYVQHQLGFLSWEPALAPVMYNTVFTAVYDRSDVTFMYRIWTGEAGTKKINVLNGQPFEFPTDIEHKAGFMRWKPSINVVTEDTIINAFYLFDCTFNYYSNGVIKSSILKLDTKVYTVDEIISQLPNNDFDRLPKTFDTSLDFSVSNPEGDDIVVNQVVNVTIKNNINDKVISLNSVEYKDSNLNINTQNIFYIRFQTFGGPTPLPNVHLQYVYKPYWASNSGSIGDPTPFDKYAELFGLTGYIPQFNPKTGNGVNRFIVSDLLGEVYHTAWYYMLSTDESKNTFTINYMPDIALTVKNPLDNKVHNLKAVLNGDSYVFKINDFKIPDGYSLGSSDGFFDLPDCDNPIFSTVLSVSSTLYINIAEQQSYEKEYAITLQFFKKPKLTLNSDSLSKEIVLDNWQEIWIKDGTGMLQLGYGYILDMKNFEGAITDPVFFMGQFKLPNYMKFEEHDDIHYLYFPSADHDNVEYQENFGGSFSNNGFGNIISGAGDIIDSAWDFVEGFFSKDNKIDFTKIALVILAVIFAPILLTILFNLIKMIISFIVSLFKRRKK